MYKISLLDKISFLLVLIGAINWGFIGLFNVNIVSLFSLGSILLQRIIYITICAAAINIIILVFKCELFKFSN
ncbi:DUF378 domain-containing protein [Clostridium sp. Sa3CUN1]|uniref:DUF378 domain-containing protein n=1 Tax=Clostridium gallinarum TaxID=2762246 RepID=A0ABR8Q813_9CLOT|nr:DUF378 domain-containing protein [Clostridium gallinarum]MBD7916565.1 DUF378 domain-containing protein [Clostridium gallinarum]